MSFAPAAEDPCPANATELYRNAVVGPIEKWMVTLIVLAAIVGVLYLALRLLPARWCGEESRRNPWRRLALSLWTVIVAFSTVTWLKSVYACNHHSRFVTGGYLLLALFILGCTFVLEGLEAAYTELRDKSEEQFEHGVAASVFQRVRNMDKKAKSFYVAREWWIVSLVVIATIIIENDSYTIPGIGQVGGDTSSGHIVRILLSLVLTTFPFVWLAQGPGKYVAMSNSVQFLEYRVTGITVWVLEKMWLRSLDFNIPWRWPRRWR